MEELIQIKIEFYIQFVVPENLYPPDHAIHDHLFCLEGGVVIEVSPGNQLLILVGQMLQKLFPAQNSGFRFFILISEFAALRFGIPDQSGKGILRKSTLALDAADNFCPEHIQGFCGFAQFGLYRRHVGFPKVQFLGISCLNQIVLGNALHLAEDSPDHLVDDIIQNVHGVSGGAVTFRLLSGLAVADIADAGRFVHSTIPQAAILSAGGKAQPCTAVTTEHIASQQGLSSGIQRNRGLLPCMVSPLLPDSLGSFKLLGCNNL